MATQAQVESLVSQTAAADDQSRGALITSLGAITREYHAANHGVDVDWRHCSKAPCDGARGEFFRRTKR